ncbi:46 kDa FK506-binding nuclear protein-like [Cloeon dipterum]|uniref:46 kDa FK506-binding nuclear protein-like n=1 Tax=Cloeon dipterum TaxID=197152 RepID=UPI00321F9463
MFWGLTLERGKKYVQKVRYSFHISMAALDLRVPSSQEVTVILLVGESEFVLCNLQAKHHVLQQQLDLNFLRGQEIVFSLCGYGKVTLSGFFVPSDFEESEEEDEEDEEAPQLMPIADKKKKKKLKTLPLILDSDDKDEDESDDMAEDSDSVESEEDSELEEEEDSDEYVRKESDDDELDSDGDDSEESDVEVPQPAKKKLQTPQKQVKLPKAQEQKTPNKARNGAATPKVHHSGKREKQAPKGRGRNVFK